MFQNSSNSKQDHILLVEMSLVFMFNNKFEIMFSKKKSGTSFQAYSTPTNYGQIDHQKISYLIPETKVHNTYTF